MDLVYADENMKDIGILNDYSLDMAYGSSENNFQLSISRSRHCCNYGYFIYMEYSDSGKVKGTEYGGMIDEIKVSTDKETLIYCGKTWQGLLADNHIEPEPGYDYFIVSGEANACISDVIKHIGMEHIFNVSQDDSGIEIVNYAFRYVDAYTGLQDMLNAHDGKLMIEHKGKTVELSASYIVDYSQDEEWDNTQVHFDISEKKRPINHLICLGGGDLKDRKVIHLYTDINGGVQPYSRVTTPVQDSDYILDKSNQFLFGIDKVDSVLDYPNAQVTENYIKLEKQPADWDKKYNEYYRLDENDSYIAFEDTEEQTYTLLTAQPSNWANGYSAYYMIDETDYKTVEGIVTGTYRLQSVVPTDWQTNYGNYYYYYSDGVTSEYKSVEGVKKTRYKVQTQKPTDWKSNYGNYYKKKKSGGYVAVEGVKKGKKTIAPTWKAKKYYTSEDYDVAPKWSQKYYTYVESVSSPDWTVGMYYTLSTVTVRPSYIPGGTYKKVLDHYADLIRKGLEIIKQSLDCNSISINLDMSGKYDIGDIVGASDNEIGISVWQPISKKIVQVVNNVESISYEIGKE